MTDRLRKALDKIFLKLSSLPRITTDFPRVFLYPESDKWTIKIMPVLRSAFRKLFHFPNIRFFFARDGKIGHTG